MTVTVDMLRASTDDYLARHPDEGTRLRRLVAELATGADLTSRSRFRGHVTCGAVLVDGRQRVLHIHHRTLRRWLLPGGHVEAADASLADAALREAHEETGIPVGSLRAFGGAGTFDIAVHAIPANPGKGEPAHWHFDFRYAFRVVDEPTVRLQFTEVSAYRWLAGDEICSPAVRRKLDAVNHAFG